MQYVSTRQDKTPASFITAMQRGLAPDGGLYIPERFPLMDVKQFDLNSSYSEFAAELLRYFMEGDLGDQLNEICKDAFNFPIVMSSIDDKTNMLELYHGPTLSFKDFGARFLAECMQRVLSDKIMTIMVATSGDTGSAVAAAFYKMKNIRVIVLFPKGQISQRQQHQITCWGDNISALAVEGSFDDCQQLVKAAFANPLWQQHTHLSTANSINIARLLPQVVIYAYASLKFQAEHGESAGFIVPSGNLGNVTAAYWAKKLGFPLREIAIATNANHVVEDYLHEGQLNPRPSVKTLANAMDVGNPSNFERLQLLHPEIDQFRREVQAFSVVDEQIRFAILDAYQQHQLLLCPHTATAYFMRQHLSNTPWFIVATADPCKFETIIEPLLDIHVPVALQLQELLNRPTHFVTIPPTGLVPDTDR